MTTVEVGGRTIEISNPDKEMYPGEGITKLDVATYYRDVAGAMVPHLRERPLHMERYPDGIGGRVLQQKQAPDYFPDWIERASVERKSGGSLQQPVCNDAAALVYLAGQACLTPHRWPSTRTAPTTPDLLVFDLDPSGPDLDAVVDAARAMRELLEELDLHPAPMSTGSRGLHLIVPLQGREDYDAVREFAHTVAELLAARDPRRLTVEQRKQKRRGRVFIDTLRNGYAQTAVAPYALRAVPGAAVAAPLEWREVGHGFDPRRHTLRDMRRRLDRNGDLLADLHRRAGAVEPAAARLRQLGHEPARR